MKKGSVEIMLIDNPWIISVIILLVMAGIYKALWIAMLSLSSGIFLVTLQLDICSSDKRWLYVVSGIAFLAFLYFLFEAIRIAQWRDKYYHPSDDTIASNAPPFPENIILKGIKNIFRRLST